MTPWGASSAVEQGTFNPLVEGSNPSPLTRTQSTLAQTRAIRKISVPDAYTRPTFGKVNTHAEGALDHRRRDRAAGAHAHARGRSRLHRSLGLDLREERDRSDHVRGRGL